MNDHDATVLVLGATGQQGGSVAAALRDDGWQVRALVRDPDSAKAQALRAAGVKTVRGDLSDATSLRAAAAGAYGVFSVQPSSGQGDSGVSDADEVRFGTAVADAAVAAGVEHLVYSSSSAAGSPTGVGHFDSKTRVEEHVRGLAIDTTVVRPSTFMEILLLPDFGLPDGKLSFFVHPDQAMQFVAVQDIGRLVARVFAQRSAHRGVVLELAGDAATGRAARGGLQPRDRAVHQLRALHGHRPARQRHAECAHPSGRRGSAGGRRRRRRPSRAASRTAELRRLARRTRARALAAPAPARSPGSLARPWTSKIASRLRTPAASTCSTAVGPRGSSVHATRMPLRTWLWAADLVATHHPGISAKQLQRRLGLTRYETAWLILHKLRRAMVAPECGLLVDEVEVDEFFVGGVEHGLKGGRRRGQRASTAGLQSVAQRWAPQPKAAGCSPPSTTKFEPVIH